MPERAAVSFEGFTDSENRIVFDIGQGRSEVELRGYLSFLRGRYNVCVVCESSRERQAKVPPKRGRLVTGPEQSTPLQLGNN